jgi:hypothetical protein
MLLNPFQRRAVPRSVSSGRTRSRSRDRLTIESLEIRNLLSAVTWPGLQNPQREAALNDTLDVAQHLGSVENGSSVEFVGSISGPSLGDGETESLNDSATELTTDVDWYYFTLDLPGRVQLMAMPGTGAATSPVVLTLYGDQVSEFDPSLPLQRHLLGRQEGTSNGQARPVDVQLDAGAYFLAVSGTGNRFFHPFVADSGLPGQATDYGVRISLTSGQTPPGNPDQFASPVEHGLQGDDVPETATDLGNLTARQRLQVGGTIGDDRFYDLASEDPFAMNPAADVDVYRFSITGDGSFALIAETFAGRIGSALDSALTLYRADDTGSLQFVATNNNSLNPTETTNGYIPFFSDAVLFAGLSAGDYFIAVSSSGNDAEYGPDGIFDPQIAHSGLNGYSVGGYVLDLTVFADNVAPQVVSQVLNSSGFDDVILSAEHVANVLHAPTHLNVQFSETVNLQQLAYQAYVSVGTSTVSAVFIEGADGTRYFPRLESYDIDSGVARLLMLDGLPNGDYAVHVSGALGLTDGAANAVIGNDTSGDFVSRFTVSDASRGAGRLRNGANNESLETAQDLGVLFPHELQSGVTLVRNAATNAGQPADADDYFRFEVLQTQSYFFSLSGFGDGVPPAIEVLNDAGQAMSLTSLPGGQGLLGFLPAGKYVLHLGSWETAVADNVIYQVEIELAGAAENPTPLSSGAAPAVGIQLIGQVPGFIGQPIQTNLSTTTTTAAVASSSVPPAPSGINDSFATLPLGLPANSTLAVVSTPHNNQIVHLFGLGDRDRLFSLIDSSLSRPSTDAVSVTKAELSDDELQFLLKLNSTVVDEVEFSTPESSPAAINTDDAEPANENNVSGSLEATGEFETSANSEVTQSPESSNNSQPLATRPARSNRATRNPQTKVRPADDQNTSASTSPVAIALAISLASTLRERHRRDELRRLLTSDL